MAYQFRTERSNPRPNLPNSWQQIERGEVIERAPGCARAFLSSLDVELPELAKNLVFLRHPDDDDVFALYEATPPGIGLQFDVALEYIVVWSLKGEPQTGEYGDWQGVDAQVLAALDHVRSLVGATKG